VNPVLYIKQSYWRQKHIKILTAPSHIICEITKQQNWKAVLWTKQWVEVVRDHQQERAWTSHTEEEWDCPFLCTDKPSNSNTHTHSTYSTCNVLHNSWKCGNCIAFIHTQLGCLHSFACIQLFCHQTDHAYMPTVSTYFFITVVHATYSTCNVLHNSSMPSLLTTLHMPNLSSANTGLTAAISMARFAGSLQHNHQYNWATAV